MNYWQTLVGNFQAALTGILANPDRVPKSDPVAMAMSIAERSMEILPVEPHPNYHRKQLNNGEHNEPDASPSR